MARPRWRKTAALLPNIVLMDIDMPGEDGIATTPPISCSTRSRRAPRGILVKNIRSSELLDQLRGLKQGEAAISRRMAARILAEFQRGQAATGSREGSLNDLTARELEVLELVADRLSNKRNRGSARHQRATVKNHLKNILSKLHLRSRRQAADYGVARGWVRPAEPTG